MRLHPGDTVVEIGCGTGLNFSLLRDAVGAQGKVIGVDITAEMLDRAKRRVARNAWSNVELVHSDAASYEFPEATDGVLSTLAFSASPSVKQRLA